MAMIELKVPNIGGSTNVNVAEVYVKVGDVIAKDDNLLMLETDKATMEVPAEAAGVVKELAIKVGSQVNEGDVILKLEVTDSANTSAPAVAQQVEVIPVAVANEVVNNVVAAKDAPLSPPTAPVAAPLAAKASSEATEVIFDENGFSKAFASPSIRRLARELGVNLAVVIGSGTKGRITESDVKGYVKGVMSGQTTAGVANSKTTGLDLLPWPTVDFSKYGEVEVQPLSRIKKISGSNLARNWVMIPHVTQFDEADITELEQFRKELNEEYKKADVKVTPLAFLIKACVYALKKFPEFNASLDGDNLVYKKYYNIGFAADTPSGLVVPVVKDANKKGIVALAKETSSLASLAREGKLKPTDMQGGTFTISSLGGIGGSAFTPIINAPEVAILGVSKSATKPMWNGKEFLPRLMLPLCLSYDHRIIDGALAARFTTYLAQVLSDIRRLVL